MSRAPHSCTIGLVADFRYGSEAVPARRGLRGNGRLAPFVVATLAGRQAGPARPEQRAVHLRTRQQACEQSLRLLHLRRISVDAAPLRSYTRCKTCFSRTPLTVASCDSWKSVTSSAYGSVRAWFSWQSVGSCKMLPGQLRQGCKNAFCTHTLGKKDHLRAMPTT